MLDHKPRRIKRWMLILPLSCALLTLPFFIGIRPNSDDHRPPPSPTFPVQVSPIFSQPQATPSVDATNVIYRATILADTAEAELAALDATATWGAVLDATATMQAYIESLE